MPVDDRFVFRSYEPGDEEAILQLFARSFGVERSAQHFAWKYRENPFGNQHIGLAWHDGKLVAQYGGYVVPFWYREEEMAAHQIADIMSDASVRHVGRGPTSVFARTAAHFYRAFCQDQIAFNYGFSTGTSRSFGNRFLGVEAVEPVAYRRRDQVRKVSRLRRWTGSYRLELVREAGAEFDRLFERVAPSYAFLVRRDAAYIRWRYLQFAEAGYFVIAIRKRGRLTGWSAFRVRDQTLLWGDALFDSGDAAAPEILLRHVAPAYPISTIECWFTRRPAWFHDALTRLAFALSPEPNDLTLGCAPFKFANAVSAIRESLYYTMGDSDLF